MSLAAQRTRWRDRELALHRRAEPRWPGRRSQHHPVQAQELVAGRYRGNARVRYDGGRRPGWRQHGRGGAQYLATDRRESHGDRGLYQVAAGGRRAQAAAEEAGITRRPKPGLTPDESTFARAAIS